MTDQDHLDRINAITRNARSTWFALLAALVFVGITLMGVQHIDFYGVDRATQLPLVNVEVPTRFFFVAAPILTAAVYGYFHLYLIRLWDALGAAPARLNGIRLGDAITPWLVNDAALDFRARRRKDNSTTERALEGAAALLNILLAWGFGLIVLAFVWYLSLPARTFWISGVASASFVVALFTAAGSMETMFRRLNTPENSKTVPAFKRWTDYPLLAITLAGTVYVTYVVTEGPAKYLAPLDLTGENIVERPAGWLAYEDALSEFRSQFCRREFIKDCRDLGNREAEFKAEFGRRRKTEIADMRRPGWHKPVPEHTNMDFRGANLSETFLAGANLTEAQMQGANLARAQMQGAVLHDAQMQGAYLRRAQMQGAVLGYSQLKGTWNQVNYLIDTNLSKSINNGGMLRFADLTGADFDTGTDFRNTFLDGSVTMTDDFRVQMGDPCQWAQDPIKDDGVFYGRWRGWIEAAPGQLGRPYWELIAPEGFKDVEAIAPDAGCDWKTDPMIAKSAPAAAE